MRKILIILLISSMILISACSPDEAQNDLDTSNDSAGEASVDPPSEADEDSNVDEINMQNYTLTVPSSYELLEGGYDGRSYSNAILKPKDSIAYELEFDFGIFFIHSVDSRKGIIAHDYGATALDISTEEFVQEGVAYTYTFEHETRGLVQAIELVTGTNPIYYMRGFIDVKDDQGVNDPTKVLSSFIAENIIMVDYKAD